MRSLLSAVVLSTLLVAPAMAEPRSFSVNDPSGQFLLEVLFPQAPQGFNQLARALITVRDKATLEILQQLQTPAGNVPLDRNGRTDTYELVGDHGLLYFADINGDGRQDLAIRNGSDAVDDSQLNYDVYLQDPQQRQWQLNQPLSDLANANFGGMFSVNAKDGVIHSQTDRGCCWTRASRWQMRNGTLLQLSAYTQEEVPANDDDTTSMPSGYMLRTTGEWKDGQWRETPRLEGPVNEDPQYLAGTLDGKIAVQLWYQQQGAVLIGEVRYGKTGNVKPIKLVGERGDYADESFVYLHELGEDGHQTGIWRITQDNKGTWVTGAKHDERERAIELHRQDPEPEYSKLDAVAPEQRSGHYQMRTDFLDRDGDLELNILPERDAQGREVAEFTVTIKEAASGKVIVSAHHRVPMQTPNLIILSGPQASPRAGPYHIQLVKNFAVIKHNSAPDDMAYLTGNYRKQP